MGKQHEKALKLSELMKATSQCCRNVRWKSSVIAYENKALLKNYALKKEIEKGQYKISPYIEFYVYEPKTRLIHATRMRDRVWQRSLRNNGLYDDLTRGFIRSNTACQIGKGTDYAVEDLVDQLRRYYRRHGTNKGHAAHLDIRSYFPTTPHDVAKGTLTRRVRDLKISEHAKAVIDSCKDYRTDREKKEDPRKRGVYLGSEIFQLVQIANLDKIDHYIKEHMHVDIYSRYNDDFIIGDRDLEKVKTCVKYVEEELGIMGLSLNKKSVIDPTENGIHYLKRNIKLTATGKVLVLMEHKAISEERRKLRKLKGLLDKGKITMKDVEKHYEGWTANKKKCHTRGLRKKMNQYYFDLFGIKPTVTLKGGRKN